MSIESDQERFSGYQLPKIQLTAGFDVYYMGVHPYYFNQPLYWTKQATRGNVYPFYGVVEADYPIQDPSPPSPLPTSDYSGSEFSTGLENVGETRQVKQSQQYKLLPI